MSRRRDASRVIHWPAMRNVRDLGGLPLVGGGKTQPDIVIRSDTPARLSPAGPELAMRHPVRTVIDLREERLVARQPNPLAVAEVVRGLLAGRPPALMHCHSGTGLQAWSPYPCSSKRTHYDGFADWYGATPRQKSVTAKPMAIPSPAPSNMASEPATPDDAGILANRAARIAPMATSAAHNNSGIPIEKTAGIPRAMSIAAPKPSIAARAGGRGTNAPTTDSTAAAATHPATNTTRPPGGVTPCCAIAER